METHALNRHGVPPLRTRCSFPRHPTVRGFLPKSLTEQPAANRVGKPTKPRHYEIFNMLTGGILPAEWGPGTAPWLMGKRFLLQKAEPGAQLALKFIKSLCLSGHGDKEPGGGSCSPELSKAAWRDLSTPLAE